MSKYMRSRHVPLAQEEPVALGEEIEAFTDEIQEAGVTLKSLRQQRGWSRTELGQKVEMDADHIALLETGEQKIPVVIAKRFAEIFHTSHHIFL